MGGSLGLAVHAGGLAGAVVGFDSQPGVAERARDLGAVDVAVSTIGEAVREADLVVLAVPVLAERELLASLPQTLRAEAVVTDLGGTKELVCAWAAASLPNPSRFVGGHPMTGREQAGIDAAEATLYSGCVWCVTPLPQTSPDAVRRVADLARALGAQPITLNDAEHDRLVAGASHLPLLAAVALVRTLGSSQDWSDVAELAAGGFRDTTRVASGDPRMARDICLTNGPAIVTRLDAYIAELLRLREHVAQAAPELLEDFGEARAIRESWVRRTRML